MIESDEILEKILRTSQITGLKARVEGKDISLKEMMEVLNEYHAWTEIVFERYYQESKYNFTQSIEILRLKKDNEELKNEVKNLNKQINF